MRTARTPATILLAALIGTGAMGGGTLPEGQDEGAEYARLRISLQNYITGRWGQIDADTGYRAALVDLNGDGRREAVVLMNGPGWCGSGGCSLWVLTPRGQSWRMVTQATVMNPPIRVLPPRSHGWSELSAMADDGAGPDYEVRLSVNGRLNPTITRLPEPSNGRVILSDANPVRALFP
ncbi:MAG: hypothetical protein KKF88_06890 [Alphaproteobacteria bacterium]|nr:hypothetical protein [Alphaproteobacteria bacterium]